MVKWIFNGDRNWASRYRGEGVRLLYQLKAMMKLTGVRFYSLFQSYINEGADKVAKIPPGSSYVLVRTVTGTKVFVRVEGTVIPGTPNTYTIEITADKIWRLKKKLAEEFNLLFLIRDATHYVVWKISNNGQSLEPYNLDISKFITIIGSTLLVAQSPPSANVHHVGISTIYNPTIENYAFPYPYIPQDFTGGPYIWDNGRIKSLNLTEGYSPIATGRRHFGLSDGKLAWKYRTITKNSFFNTYQIAYEIDVNHMIVQEDIRSNGGKLFFSGLSLSLELVFGSGSETVYWDVPAYAEGYHERHDSYYTEKHFVSASHSLSAENDTPIQYLAVLNDKELYTVNNIDSSVGQFLSAGGKLVVVLYQGNTHDFQMSRYYTPPYEIIIGNGETITSRVTSHRDFDYLTTTNDITDITQLFISNEEVDRFELIKVDTSQIMLDESPPGESWEAEGYNGEWSEMYFPPPAEAYGWFSVVNFVCLKKAITSMEGDYVIISIHYVLPDTYKSYNLLVTNTTKNWTGEVFDSVMDYDYMEDNYVYLCAYHDIVSTQIMKHTTTYGIDITYQAVPCTDPTPIPPIQYDIEGAPEIYNIKVKDILNDKNTYKWKLVYNIGNGVQEVILTPSYYHQIKRDLDERDFKYWTVTETESPVIDPIPSETIDESYKGERITGFSVQMNDDYIFYTYIIENTDVNETSTTWGMDAEGIYHPIGDDFISLIPEWVFVKRIVGIIVIKTGNHIIHEITDELLSDMYSGMFDKEQPAAIGIHKLKKEVV